MKFVLPTLNGVVALPNTMGVENVKEKLNNKRGGFVHIVAYTKAKALKRANDLGLDLVKITDIMVVMGKHKTEPTEGVVEPTRPLWFSHIADLKGRDYYLIKHNENGKEYFQCHTTTNPKHRAKTYYVDRNTGVLYSKQYLVENRLISSSRTSDSSNAQFDLENIISL